MRGGIAVSHSESTKRVVSGLGSDPLLAASHWVSNAPVETTGVNSVTEFGVGRAHDRDRRTLLRKAGGTLR